MNVLKRVLALALSLVMIASMSTVLVFAAGGGQGNALGVSGWFTPGNPAVGVSQINFDGKKDPPFDVAVREGGKFLLLDWPADFTITPDENALKLVAKENQDPTGSPYNVLVLEPTVNGDITITHKSSGSLLTVNATNIQKPKPPLRSEINQVYPGGSFAPMEMTKRVENFAYQIPFAVVKVDKVSNPPKTEVTDITDQITNLTVAFATTAGTAEVSTVLRKGTGNKLVFTPIHEGSYTATFTYTCPIENKLKTQEVLYIVEPPRGESIISVPVGSSITAAIQGVTEETTAAKETIIQLDAGTYTQNVTLSKRVTLRGVEGTVLKGSITITAADGPWNDELAAHVENLTVQSASTGTGTGIVGSGAGYGSVMNVTIKDFAVGFDNTATKSSFAFGGLTLEGNGTGLKLKPRAGQRQSTGGMVIKNNTVGVQIIPGNNANPYAFALVECNFIGNGTHVQNDVDVAYNFSRNYYDTVSGKFKGTKEVVYYPRYQEALAITPSGTNADSLSLTIDADKLGNVPMENGAIDKLDTSSFAGKPVKLQMDNVKPDGSASKMAGWEFAAAANVSTQPFNPTVDTRLKPSSSSALGQLPAGAKYQPVSFAHSGALPRTATVSVKKDADAPTTGTLNLYKVENGQLVLQTDKATYNGTEFVFNRDGCSDYLITDAVISGGTPSTGGETSGDSSNYLSSEDVSSQLNNPAVGAQGTVFISVATQPLVGAAAFDALGATPGKTLVLKGDGYSWSILGSTVHSIPGLYTVNTTISGISPNAAEIKKLTGNAVIQNVYFSFHGALPFTAMVTLEVEPGLAGKKLNLYHVETQPNQLVLMQSGLQVKNGKVSFPVTTCSDYILTADTIPGAAAAAVQVKNPNTGANDVVPLALALALFSGLGAAVLLTKKKR